MLLTASYGTLFPAAYSPRVLSVALPLMTKANPRLLSCGTFHVAVEPGGEIVGCGGWTFERPGSGERTDGAGHIRHFATHPGWTRCGVGRALVQRCVDEALGNGLEFLECQSSLVAESFYRAQGFVAIEDIEIELAPNVMFPGVLMRRRIR